MANNSQFVFRRTDVIGNADASQDHSFLSTCFVDNGDYTLLKNVSDPRRIVVGRTGSGKTALLLQLQREVRRNVIKIEPESLSLNHISNSNILSFVERLGVKLDLVFRLLWRHVFVIEVLRRHFESHEDIRPTVWSMLERYVSPRPTTAQRAAIRYLKEWGDSFWQDTDYRVKEVTRTIERKLQGELEPKLSVGGDYGVGLSIGKAAVGAQLTDELVIDLRKRAQSVINQVQVRELSGILEILRSLLESQQSEYIIVIDRLDESWVEHEVKLPLLRALIETVRDFGKVGRVKIVVALRRDLLDRIFKYTRDEGFQEEKYEALFLDVSWDETDLKRLLDIRISEMIRHRYTKRKVTSKDVLPQSVDGVDALDYLISRTLMRPRDLIAFFNECIVSAAGKSVFTSDMIREAEGAYSRKRLDAIADEWRADYPNLMHFVDILKKRPASFVLSDLSEAMRDLIVSFATSECLERTILHRPQFEHLKMRICQCLQGFGLIFCIRWVYWDLSWNPFKRSIFLLLIGERCRPARSV